MDKQQLLIETYVDAYLDEVEIREIFIQEGIMSTPVGDIVKALTQRLKHGQQKVLNSKAKIAMAKEGWKKSKEWKTRLGDPHKGLGPREWHRKLLKAQGDYEWNVRQVKEIKRDIVMAKRFPGLLGNVPHLYTIIGVTLIIATISYSAYKIYKQFFTKAARTCKDKRGKVKTACMLQYQIKGLQASKKPFSNGLKGCSKAKDIPICKAKFNNKLNKIDTRIKKKRDKIKKLAGK